MMWFILCKMVLGFMLVLDLSKFYSGYRIYGINKDVIKFMFIVWGKNCDEISLIY